jgi:acyl-CoA thioesterase YciA
MGGQGDQFGVAVKESADESQQVMPMSAMNSPASEAASRPAQTLTGPLSLPDGSELVMRVMPMPADANGNGDIFGGWIMAQVDLAGAVLPARIAKGRIATVAVNQFIFKQPVSVGDLVSFYARVTRVGNTSITVHVEVHAERNPANLQVVKVTEANLTYVAIDADGKPRPVLRG